MTQKLPALLALVFGLATTGWASNETVLWNFTKSNGDGAYPWSNVLISDSSGNLYGVTGGGGTNSAGMVFELSPDGHGGYSETVIYDFKGFGSGDGSAPYGSLARDAAGHLYGTTQGGGTNGTGTVYMLSPKSGGGWTERILYSFSASGATDGANPSGGVILGKNQTLYGTTTYGGAYSSGTVFQLSKTQNGIAEKVLHHFGAAGDGAYPYDPLVADPEGNLYGATSIGGASGSGSVYRLSLQNGTWTESLLHSFTGTNGDGSGMYYVGLIGDKSRNIYGTTAFGGTNGTGTVWELVYSKSTNSYSEKILYSFGAISSGDANYPYGGLVMDGAGTLYGTTEQGGSTENSGAVFKLTSPDQRGQKASSTISRVEASTGRIRPATSFWEATAICTGWRNSAAHRTTASYIRSHRKEGHVKVAGPGRTAVPYEECRETSSGAADLLPALSGLA